MLPDLGFRCPFALPSIALILEPSRGVVLLDVAARASGSPGSLPLILWGSLRYDRDAGSGRTMPVNFSVAAFVTNDEQFPVRHLEDARKASSVPGS